MADVLTSIPSDFLGTGTFNTDGDNWKIQRKISSHEFITKPLHKYIEDVVKIELFGRLISILETTAEQNPVIDHQDILQRFAFDHICKLSFGFDPAYLSASLNRTEFAIAFEDATQISSVRFGYVIPLLWKLNRYLNIGSEKKLRQATSTDLDSNISTHVVLHHFDDDFVIDIVISFILAGHTTSAALTWFFWLVSCNPKRVTYSPFAMGRMDNLWGSDRNEFKPEIWLEIDKATGKSHFVAKDSFTYP
ncbi:hypothetical protein MKX01_002348, partial [Papaver californicum]